MATSKPLLASLVISLLLLLHLVEADNMVNFRFGVINFIFNPTQSPVEPNYDMTLQVITDAALGSPSPQIGN